jgi:hypothetical protein
LFFARQKKSSSLSPPTSSDSAKNSKLASSISVLEQNFTFTKCSCILIKCALIQTTQHKSWGIDLEYISAKEAIGIGSHIVLRPELIDR